MKLSRRQSNLRSLDNGRRRKSFLKGTKRRLFAEQLETRVLLAGDVFQNYDDPFDTDRDGHFAPVDILHVINQINTPTSPANGEGPGSGSVTFFNDVNGDGYVSPIDALQAINEYNARNAEGAGEPLVRIRMQAVAIDKDINGLDVPLTTIAKGTDYYLKVTVQDLRMGSNPPTGNPNGVYAAYLDVLYQKAQTNVEIEEIQQITLGNNPGSGNFKLTFDPDGAGPLAAQTTGNITYTLAGVAPENTIATNIQNALNTTFGKNNMLVTPVSSGDTTRYFIRFQGKFGDQDVAMMSGNVSGLIPQVPGDIPTLTVTEVVKGVYSLEAFRRAFRFSPQYDQPAGNGETGGANDGQLTPFVDANRMDEVGNFAVGTSPLGSSIRELFRVRMNTVDAGTVSITGDVALADLEIPAHNTLIFGGGVFDPNNRDVVAPSEIDLINPASFTVTETFSAKPDTFTFTETASPAAQALNVKANDTPQPLTGISVTKINGGTAPVNLSNGTVTLTAGAISFTPIANVNGSATFTYTLANAAGVTDTATVTIGVTAVNNAPVNHVSLVTQPTPEETALIFNSGNGNAISITDIDANETVGATLDVDLSVTHGTLSLGSIPGAPFAVVGGSNNTSAMVIRGTLADLNTALTNLSYLPVLNYVGSDSLRIVTNDRGNTGGPIAGLSDTDTVSINVTPVNDAPVVVVPVTPPNLSVLAGDPLTITGTSTSDVDVGAASLKVTLTATTLNATDTHITLGATAGLSFTVGKENGKAEVEFTGTLVAVNAALASFEYIPAIDDGGSTTLVVVSVNDQGATGDGPVGGLTTAAAITVDVIPLTYPFARRDPTPGNTPSETAFKVAENSTNNALPVLVNDLVDAGSNPILVSVNPAAHGTVSLGTGADLGKVIYTPSATFWGTDTFTYVMNEDNHPGSLDSTATVTVTILNTNDAPAAVDSATSTNEDIAKDIVLSVSDVDDNNNQGFVSTLTPTVLTGPAHGTATVNANGTIHYTPAQDFFSGVTDSFTYIVSDGSLSSTTATVTITVNPVNDAPVALNGTLTASEDILTAGTLVATDVDGPTITYILVSPANAHGTVTITDASTGAYTYQTDLNYNGPASFTFKANDGSQDSNTATVTITVTPVNDAPLANPDTYLVENDTLLNANVPTAGDPRATVRANDSDVDNSNPADLTVSLVTGPSQVKPGTTFQLNSNGSFTYTAASTFIGFDTFVYKLSDPSGDFTTATVTIDVREKNDPPVAVNDSYTVDEDTPLDVPVAEGVRDGVGTDSDPDSNSPNSTLVVFLVPGSGPVHAKPGSFLLRNDGSFTYQADDQYNGSDSFKYFLKDAFNAQSNTATVTITINEVNDPPTAVDDGSVASPITLIKNTAINPFINQEIDVLKNDSAFPDFYKTNPPAGFNNINETLTITSVGDVLAPSLGTATFSPDHLKVLYTPTEGLEGTDTFSYTISDGNGGFATAFVYVEVVNFIPTEIMGKVFIDTNNNGIQDGTEKALAGVKIILTGHDDIFNFDYGADTDGNTINDVPALVTYTNSDGNYAFQAPGLSPQQHGMRPGTYLIFEEQPAFMRDGKDHAGNNASLVYDADARSGDTIQLTLPLLGVGAPGQPSASQGNNFAERGLDANSVSINDILASSNSTGLMFALNGSSQLWAAQLGANWTNLDHVTVLVNNSNSVTFTFYDKFSVANNLAGVSRTLSQTGNSSYYNGARFHFLGTSGSSSSLLQLDASASDLGLNLLAAGDNGQQPEGEADGDAGYVRSVDELMAAVGNV